MSPIHVGACVAGGQGPVVLPNPATGLLFLWGGCDKEGDILASLRSWCLTRSEWHEGGGHTVTWGRQSEAGGLEEGADLAGWRNSRKTSGSEESEQGDERELVSRQWVTSLEVGWKSWMVQSRGGMWSDVGVKRFL